MTRKNPVKTKKPAGRIEVRKSGVHGRGVYATKPISKGARIIEYTGKRILWEDVPNDLDDPHTFLFGLDDEKEVIDPTTGGNEARWINHSCDPNCEAIEENGRVFIYALRNLRPGQTLFPEFYRRRIRIDLSRTIGPTERASSQPSVAIAIGHLIHVPLRMAEHADRRSLQVERGPQPPWNDVLAFIRQLAPQLVPVSHRGLEPFRGMPREMFAELHLPRVTDT